MAQALIRKFRISATWVGFGLMFLTSFLPFVYAMKYSSEASCVALMASVWMLGVKLVDMDMGTG